MGRKSQKGGAAAVPEATVTPKNAAAADTGTAVRAQGDDAQPAAAPVSFSDLGLSSWLARQCGNVGFGRPTPVQRNCIGPILAGRDVSASAKTGSGKTAAFALPVLHQLGQDPYGVFCVVLTPTRELAFQIADQFRVLGKPIGLRDVVVVGGVEIMNQAVELSHRPHIVVATPGRLAHHVMHGNVNLSRLRFLVLDEADRLMTNESMQPDLKRIFDKLPSSKQTLLFSATMPGELSGQFVDLVRQPVFTYNLPSPTATVSKLTQQYLFIPSHVRHAYFISLLRSLEEGASKIVFTSTCQSCEELSTMLRVLDMRCVALHSQMSQAKRLAALGKFKSNIVPILVATDVASRGLDIPLVQVVVNFNVPKAVDDYVHRVGRTARAGRGGRAVTLVSERDVDLVHAIEARVHVKMEAYEGVSEEEVLQSMSKTNIARREASLKLIESGFGERKERLRAKKRAGGQADVEPASGGKQPSKRSKAKPAATGKGGDKGTAKQQGQRGKGKKRAGSTAG